MNWDFLKNEFKEKRYSNIYLFYGEERYVINTYLKKYKETFIDDKYVTFNYVVLEGRNNIEQRIMSNISTLPMLSEHKMVVVKNSKLFESAGKHDDLLEALSDIDKKVHLFFIEEKVNKTVTMYKRLKDKKAVIIDFEYMTNSEIGKWLFNKFKKDGIEIESKTADYFINYVGSSMDDLEKEVDKLINYVGENGKITEGIIDKVCIKSLQAKVFDMLDAISNKNKKRAFDLLNDMLALKEPIQKINVLVARQFRIMYLVKELKNKNKSSSEIAKALKLAPFIVSKTISQVENYTIEELQNALKDILDLDCKSKTGRIDAIVGLEALISKY